MLPIVSLQEAYERSPVLSLGAEFGALQIQGDQSVQIQPTAAVAIRALSDGGAQKDLILGARGEEAPLNEAGVEALPVGSSIFGALKALNDAIAAGSGASTLQEAYEGGNTLVTSSAEGDFDVSGTEKIRLISSLGPGSGNAIEIDASAVGGAISIKAPTSGSISMVAGQQVTMSCSFASMNIGPSGGGMSSSGTGDGIGISSLGASGTLTLTHTNGSTHNSRILMDSTAIQIRGEGASPRPVQIVSTNAERAVEIAALFGRIFVETGEEFHYTNQFRTTSRWLQLFANYQTTEEDTGIVSTVVQGARASTLISSIDSTTQATTAASDQFNAGDIIMLIGGLENNAGYFEVASHVGTTLTISTTPSLGFCKSSLGAVYTSATLEAKHVVVSLLYKGTGDDGIWRQVSGSTATDLADANSGKIGVGSLAYYRGFYSGNVSGNQIIWDTNEITKGNITQTGAGVFTLDDTDAVYRITVKAQATGAATLSLVQNGTTIASDNANASGDNCVIDTLIDTGAGVGAEFVIQYTGTFATANGATGITIQRVD